MSTLALDDYSFDSMHQPFLEIVDIIKFDLTAIGIDCLREKLVEIEPYNVRLLAEKVETEAEAEQCLEMGFDLFQGYYFSRPKIVTGKKISSNQIAVVELANKMHQANADIPSLTELISHDVALSYKLLRYVNSAMYGFKRQITSIGEAVFVLGLDTLVRLVHVIMAGSFDEGKSHVLEDALVRGLMCEAMAVEEGREADKGTYFMVGLFSRLDALLGIPLEEALRELPLAEDARAALLNGSGELGKVLAAVVDYCEGNIKDLSGGTIQSKRLMGFYLDVVPEARQYLQVNI